MKAEKTKKKTNSLLSITAGMLVGITVVVPFFIFDGVWRKDNSSESLDNATAVLRESVFDNGDGIETKLSNGETSAEEDTEDSACCSAETDSDKAVSENTISEDSVSENMLASEDKLYDDLTGDAAPESNDTEQSASEIEPVMSQPTYLLSYEPPDLSDIPEYTGEPYCVINNNVPFFTDYDLLNPAFEYYSDLDVYGRCGVCTASVCRELMPKEERGNIGQIKPSGWQTVKYPELISDRYLYNRCHLIAFCLAGENANEKNLITGTRYLNVTGMLPFEESIRNYVENTGNHVLYRVTPYFLNDELVARGVHMEGYSVEDNGRGSVLIFLHITSSREYL